MKTNAQLQRDVLEELDWEPSVEAAHIGVTIEDGIITLRGHVPLYAEKRMAEQVARRVHGVRAVANEIEVVPTDQYVCDDADMAAAALHSLEWDSKVPHERIQVTVENGHLALDGVVEYGYQRSAAELAVRNLPGLRSIANNLAVDPSGLLGDTKSAIEAAFRRSALLNSKEITVEIDNGAVILTGDVHSHTEIDEAERTAHSAPGVHRVVNCLTLTPWGSGPSEEWGY